jgi:3',5'-cyclic-AMP phosphodiesterase
MKIRLLKKIQLLIFIFFVQTVGPCLSQNIQPESIVFKPFKFAFIPDTHLSFEKKDDWILTNESLVILQDTIKQLDKVPDLKFVAFGGDLIDKKENKVSDMELLVDIFSELRLPYYVILGDRDADTDENYTKTDFTAEFKFNGFDNIHQSYWAKDIEDNVLLIGLDSSTSNSFSGYLPAEEMDWLKNVLDENKNKFTIIFIHHPPISDFDDNYRLKNASEFKELIKRYPQVKVVLSGHAHRNFTRNINGTLYVVSPSIVTYPNEYKILTIYSDKVTVENKAISFKQIIKKAKKLIPSTDFARQTNLSKKELYKMLKGDETSNEKEYYFMNP